jgi:hypothetical protein
MKVLFSYRFFPLISLACLVLVYAFSEITFVKCWFDGCKNIETTNISQVDEKDKDLAKIPEQLKAKVLEFETKANRVDDKVKEIEITQTAIGIKIKEISNAGVANTNANTANTNTENSTANTSKSVNTSANIAGSSVAKLKILNDEKAKLDKTLETQRAELKVLIEDKDKTKSEILGIRTQVSERYSSRMIWVFLTGVFFLLCIAAIWISVSTIKESIEEEKRSKWLLWSSGIAFVFAILLFSSVSIFPKDNYMSIMIPMFNQSIHTYGDIPFQVINFFNVLGNAATIFLVFASCAVLSDILKKKDANGSKNPPSPLNTFEDNEQNIRAILYVGALMLFVGLLRFKLLTDWHLIFVSTDHSNEFYTLLANYFKSSIGVQAGFYSILLAVIYLPVAYAIPSKDVPTPPSPNLLEKIGLPFPSDFLTRLITVLSPFLAGPLAELFKFLVGKSG